MQVATADWRAQKQPASVECTACKANSCAHYMHPVGFDLQGRPVLYTSYMMIQDSSPGPTVDHMIQVHAWTPYHVPNESCCAPTGCLCCSGRELATGCQRQVLQACHAWLHCSQDGGV